MTIMRYARKFKFYKKYISHKRKRRFYKLICGVIARYKLRVMRIFMPYKKHIIILLITIAVITAIFFAALFFNKQDQAGIIIEREVFDIQELVDKKNQKQELLEREEKYLEKIISDKLEEKASELSKKSKEEKKLFGYTKAELKFIANPRRTVEEELGIIQEPKKVKFYTQEELEDIANPK